MLLSLLGDNNVLWIAYEANVFLNLEVNQLVNGFLDGIDCRLIFVNLTLGRWCDCALGPT